MANNPYVNKVVYGDQTLIDISGDTVTAGSMLSGTTAHDKSGAAITGSIASKSSSDLTASGATVTVPAGHYASQASKSVASGSAGTPTATKGTVSNHAISVTPSVTNTEGYIAGGTKTGTAVSVSAAELVSGVLSIAASGTGIDVTNYASVDVDIPSIEMEEGEYTHSESNATSATISFSKTHSKPPTLCVLMYKSTSRSARTGLQLWGVLNIEQLIGYGFPYIINYSSISRYAGFRFYKTSSSNVTITTIRYGADSSSSSNADYLRYHVDESAIYPRTDGTTNVILETVTYEWKAYWL